MLSFKAIKTWAFTDNSTREQKFSEHRTQTAHMAWMSAALMLGMYFWDEVIDSAHAERALPYRAFGAFLLVVAGALLARPSHSRVFMKTLLGLCAMSVVWALYQIYANLDSGFVYGVAGFVYAQICILICFLGYAIGEAAIVHVIAALLPHVLAMLTKDATFSHVHYAITVWPVTLLAIVAQISLDRQYMQRLHLRGQLLTMATRDPLTGAKNRRSFWDDAPRLANEAVKRSKPISLLMIDADHFKRVNDELGHDAGDAVLVRLCQIISLQMRESDIFCRWGGEEFVALLIEANREESLTLAHRIIDAVRSAEIQLPGEKRLQVTVSIGVSSTEGGDIDTLLRAADYAMYQAKNGGRNTIRWANELTSTATA